MFKIAFMEYAQHCRCSFQHPHSTMLPPPCFPDVGQVVNVPAPPNMMLRSWELGPESSTLFHQSWESPIALSIYSDFEFCCEMKELGIDPYWRSSRLKGWRQYGWESLHAHGHICLISRCDTLPLSWILYLFLSKHTRCCRLVSSAGADIFSGISWQWECSNSVWLCSYCTCASVNKRPILKTLVNVLRCGQNFQKMSWC